MPFPDLHHPFNPPGKHWDIYDPDDFELPARFEDHKNPPPPPLVDAKQYFEETGGQPTPQHALMTTDREVQEAMALRSINRVPMIWSDPSSRTGKVTPALASTIEFSAAFLERAGVDPYFGIQGQSFLPCIHGANEHRNNLLIEFNDGFARNGFNTSARVGTIVNKSWQLSVYKGEGWGEN